jgi:hypothetical protein
MLPCAPQYSVEATQAVEGFGPFEELANSGQTNLLGALEAPQWCYGD